jgi:hypothetical protein
MRIVTCSIIIYRVAIISTGLWGINAPKNTEQFEGYEDVSINRKVVRD